MCQLYPINLSSRWIPSPTFLPKDLSLECVVTFSCPSLLTIGCQSLDAVYALLKERSVGFDVTKEFEASGLFVGASITVNSAQVCGAMFSPHYKITNFTQDVAAISKTPGVVAIRPVVRIPPPK